MVTWKQPPQVAGWITHLSEPLHGRLAWRLLPMLTALLFAQGRRTVAAWLRAGGLSRDYKPSYYFLGSLGRRVHFMASALLRLVARVLPLDDTLLFALDDTPTKRAGPHVEGAGIHHNPTPGPAARSRSLLGSYDPSGESFELATRATASIVIAHTAAP